ncbi:hypothetical protein [Nocardioides humi]|uniref:Uncharacterized protein n=1 Tax=Nocardioides humi TaxID=449461 RepID=A0ABN2AJU8_9ACTN|nr:hypothetical protein [Nocardioides humi]
MEMLIGAAGAIWVAAAAVVTFGLARAAATQPPFQVEGQRELGLVR